MSNLTRIGWCLSLLISPPLSDSILLFLFVLCCGGDSGAAVRSEHRSSSIDSVVFRIYDHDDPHAPYCLLAQCFQSARSTNNGTTATRSADCCDAVGRALERDDGTAVNVLAAGLRQHHELLSRQWCLQAVTTLPTVANRRLPKFSVWYAPSEPETAASSSSIFPPFAEKSTAGNGTAGIFVWDDADGTGRWFFDDDTVIDDVIRAESDASPLNKGGTPPLSLWSAHLDSDLAKSGGMHRDVQHRITVSSVPSNSDSSVQISNHTVSLYMLMYLPADLFVNVEDMFRVDSVHVNVTLVPTESIIIDQEEPAFVSPPHALLIHVQAYHVQKNVAVVLDFFTKLHVRYPRSLVATNAAAVGNFRRVVFPQPELVAATVWNEEDQFVQRVRTNGQGRQQHPLQLWVAAGHDDHYTVTLFTTLAVAVTGAIVMLRDIRATAVWD